MFPRRFTLLLDSKRRFVGRPYRARLFTLIVADCPLPHSQIAFIIGRKISPSAVTRHLLKRRLAHAIKPLVVSSSPRRYLVIAHPPLAQATYQEIESQAVTLFQEIDTSSLAPPQK